MERDNLQNVDTISSDIEVDNPPDPIKELKEIILNMQYAHNKEFEAMNEQITAMEDQLGITEADFTETYIDYPDPLELELDNEKDEEVHWEISNESMDESVSDSKEVKEFEFEVVEYLDNSIPHPPP
jgi:TPP-dependent pyruvate/acetoin dehydrogenase alpha subunit